MKFTGKLCDALQKVMPNEEPKEMEGRGMSGFGGEILMFQLAYKAEDSGPAGQDPPPADVLLEIEAAPSLQKNIKVSRAELVPVTLPKFSNVRDENYLFTTPQLAPDLLEPLPEDRRTFRPYPYQWRALWIEVRLDEELAPGRYPLSVKVRQKEETLYEDSLTLERLPGELPAQKLIHTEWFYADCIAEYYQTEVFSEAHWQQIEAFMKAAVRNGINMIYCPVFTPPLDTEVGGERLTTQLVKIRRRGEQYSFDFSLFERWVRLAEDCGFRYFEMPHLFTQWGAQHAPKIMAEEDGVLKKIFGWETEAAGEAYAAFLKSFIPALKDCLRELGILDKTYFHISDEPQRKDLESYQAAGDLVRPLLEGCHIIDALSDFAFYEQGLVKKPVPANDHIEPFLAAGIEGLWTYYCCSQSTAVSNRFIALPSYRSRIIGAQLYKFNIEGFLHWGFNFYNAQYSTRPINPYLVTDAGGAFPSGDPYLVYPAAGGEAYDSIRGRVFFLALQDLRALQYLEELTSREKVLALLEEGLEEPLTFSAYPHNESYILKLREKVNQAAARAL